MPLRNTHVLKDGTELCLIHLEEIDVTIASETGVLPGKIDDWTCEPEIAVHLRRAIVLGCRFYLWVDKWLKVRKRVE